MAEIKVAKIDSGASSKATRRELYAQVCYHYPQYTLKQASKLSARDLYLLLKTANKKEAMMYYTMTQIASAPHAGKKGEGVKQLLAHFKEIIDKG